MSPATLNEAYSGYGGGKFTSLVNDPGKLQDIHRKFNTLLYVGGLAGGSDTNLLVPLEEYAEKVLPAMKAGKITYLNGGTTAAVD